MSEINKSRREFVQKVAYVAPLVATVSVMPSIASAGSVRHGNNGVGNGPDCLPPGLKRTASRFWTTTTTVAPRAAHRIRADRIICPKRASLICGICWTFDAPRAVCFSRSLHARWLYQLRRPGESAAQVNCSRPHSFRSSYCPRSFRPPWRSKLPHPQPSHSSQSPRGRALSLAAVDD